MNTLQWNYQIYFTLNVSPHCPVHNMADLILQCVQWNRLCTTFADSRLPMFVFTNFCQGIFLSVLWQ